MIFIKFLTVELPLNTQTSSIHQFGCKSFEKQFTNILEKHIFSTFTEQN